MGIEVFSWKKTKNNKKDKDEKQVTSPLMGTCLTTSGVDGTCFTVNHTISTKSHLIEWVDSF